PAASFASTMPGSTAVPRNASVPNVSALPVAVTEFPDPESRTFPVPEITVTVGLSLAVHEPIALIVPFATSPVTSTRRRPVRNCGTSASWVITAPPRPDIDLQGSVDTGGGGGGRGGRGRRRERAGGAAPSRRGAEASR